MNNQGWFYLDSLSVLAVLWWKVITNNRGWFYLKSVRKQKRAVTINANKFVKTIAKGGKDYV
jgi:hypothetical protein